MRPTAKPIADRPDLWLDGDVVVRRHDGAPLEAVEWIHRFLGQLTFNAPAPVPYFDGASVALIDGVPWGALSYVEGEPVGWSTEPTMFELGAFLASFHDAAGSIEMEEQRPGAFPIDALSSLAGDLARIDHADRARQVIHGDFTNHNVLASGSPPKPCAVIDFMNACIEVPLFDVGCALWRSGRPAQDVQAFDPERVAAYVEGYSSVRALAADDRAAVVVYLRARGEQIIAKQAARGVTDDGPRRKLEWLAAHHDELVTA
jgi:Ser/Thr protein kinase RdoA (MazF antagonist)